MDSAKIQEALAQTLAPDPVRVRSTVDRLRPPPRSPTTYSSHVRRLCPLPTNYQALIKQATVLLEAYRSQPGYGIGLLQIVNEASNPPHLRQQAAVQFKNLVRFSWNPVEDSGFAPINEAEKHEIRTHVVQIMSSAPEKVKVQVSEALTIISDTDFPERWPTLLPALLEKMEVAASSLSSPGGGEDVSALRGVLATFDSVFKRFRGQYIDNIAKDLEYVQQVISPLLQVAGLLTARVVANNGQDATAVEAATLLLSVFYSLNSPGLTAEFEDHLSEWMDCIHKLVVLPTTRNDSDDEAPVDACKAMACECLSLFMERNEEEFAGFLETFVESVWKQLVEVGPGVGQDRLAMAAIAFLTTVARSVHFELFKGEEILKQVCQGVVIPNIRLREGDIELFEMNWVEYVRRDAEGSDSETRRRAASELVKALVEKFPGETTQLFSGYVGALLSEANADPAGKWQAKDAAVYLVTALAAKTKTSTAGATTTNELVNLDEFYASHVAPELESATASSEDRAVIKADCLRFVTVFRSQLATQTLLGMFPKCVNLLSCTNNVVHSYAATLVERLLAMKAGGVASGSSAAPNQFSTTDVGPYLQQILEKLFGALKMPDSGENEYVMRAIMRLVAFVGSAVGPVTAAALTELANILGMVARNPTQPGFNHYLFEAIAALVKFGCDGTDAGIAAVEGLLFPPFQIILQEDVQEFHPYVFQIFAQMIEKRADAGSTGVARTAVIIPDAYMQLLQPLLTPHFWERTGNIPALGRLLRAFIRASPKQIEPHVQGILGVFQKLVAMKSQDHEGMYVLDELLASLDDAVMAQYLGSVWQVIYQRLTAAKTTKFCKTFMYTGSLLAALRGGDAAGQSMDSVQPGILLMVVQNVWAPSLAQKGVLPSEKVALVGSTRLLTEASVLQSPAAAQAAAALLHAISMRCMGGSGVEVSLDDPAAATGDEFAGYSAAYAKLHYSTGEDPDVLPTVADGKIDAIQRLVQYNASQGGRLSSLAGSLDQERAAVVAEFFTKAGIA